MWFCIKVNKLYSPTNNFGLNPLALHTTLLSAHFLSNQSLAGSSSPLGSFNDFQKSQFLPSMLFSGGFAAAAAAARKPATTPWHPWSLASSNFISNSAFENIFNTNAGLFSTKDKEGNLLASILLSCWLCSYVKLLSNHVELHVEWEWVRD